MEAADHELSKVLWPRRPASARITPVASIGVALSDRGPGAIPDHIAALRANAQRRPGANSHREGQGSRRWVWLTLNPPYAANLESPGRHLDRSPAYGPYGGVTAALRVVGPGREGDLVCGT